MDFGKGKVSASKTIRVRESRNRLGRWKKTTQMKMEASLQSCYRLQYSLHQILVHLVMLVNSLLY